MIVYYDPAQARHNPSEPHVFAGQSLPPAENATRAQRILDALSDADLRQPEPLDTGLLSLVHEPEYLAFLETAHERWRSATGGSVSGEATAFIRPIPQTPWREPTHVFAQMGVFSNDVDPILDGTWMAACASAASALGAAQSVHDGAEAAYALCRPPGHHAAPSTYGGYCYLNNVALAAAWLADRGARLAILDVDAHHGNGTQAVFWRRGDVLTTSIHGDPADQFPFYTGFADERGEADGEGANLNLPLPAGSGWSTYRDALDTALEAVRAHGAEVVVVALGVDTHRADGVFTLEGQDFSALGERLATGLSTVVVQEGGYGPGVLETAVPAVLSAFA